MNNTSNFSPAREDEVLEECVRETDQKTLAIWAIDCVERVMPYFEIKFPLDPRPGTALDTLHRWITTGDFSMETIRGAALDAHAAARDVGKDTAARSVARAAGEAVSTALDPTHAIAAAKYAQQAIYRISPVPEAEAAAAQERDWQYRRLCALREKLEPETRHAPGGDQEGYQTETHQKS